MEKSEKLYEIEMIKQLKGRYFRALDTNDWTLFGDSLTEDCQAEYSDGELAFSGRNEIVAFMKQHMSTPTLLSMHNGHHPEIDLLDETHAKGIWYLQDTVLDLKGGNHLYGGGIYHDEYRKLEGQWRISKTGYSRTYECVEPLSEQLVVTKNMFQKT